MSISGEAGLCVCSRVRQDTMSSHDHYEANRSIKDNDHPNNTTQPGQEMNPKKIIMLGLGVGLLYAVCGRAPTATTGTAAKPTKVRTDVGPITHRLPKLGTLQSARWVVIDNNIDSFFSLPTPHRTYQVRGFAQLEKAKSEEFSRAFEWQQMPASWQPDTTFSNPGWIFVEWNRSEAFTKECMPPLFGSDLYWERTSGVVYFNMNVK